MSIIDKILIERRSIRKYQTEAPPEAYLEQMLSLAVTTPSSSNRQPVRFMQIASPDIKTSLQKAMEAGHERFLQMAATAENPKNLRNWINTYYRYSSFMFSAPWLLAIGTIAAPAGFTRILAEAGAATSDNRWETDADIALGLALQAVILKGQELGIASCVLTAPLAFIAGVESILHVEDVKIKCFLTLGFADEKPPAPPKKDLPQLYRVL
ncbi:MAG: nitroreductase family protein [Deltaproteobacteria bacterium]|nr:nitroreductase family protein [Deltaproteobacteria bacterium]